jgi:hypothetical protein
MQAPPPHERDGRRVAGDHLRALERADFRPETASPVVLLKMANAVFTHCTYCVAPTAPFGSGGAT